MYIIFLKHLAYIFSDLAEISAIWQQRNAGQVLPERNWADSVHLSIDNAATFSYNYETKLRKHLYIRRSLPIDPYGMVTAKMGPNFEGDGLKEIVSQDFGPWPFSTIFFCPIRGILSKVRFPTVSGPMGGFLG